MTRALPLLVLLGCATAPPDAPDASAPATRSAALLQRRALSRLEGTDPTDRLGLADRAWTPPNGADLPTAARAWVTDFAPTRGVPRTVAATLAERRRVPMRNGGGVVTFGATIDGAPVLDADVTVLLDGTLRPVAWSVGPAFGPDLSASARQRAVLDAVDALQVAIADRYGVALVPAEITDEGERPDGWESLTPTGAGVWLSRPARVRRVWWPEAGDPRPAFEVEVFGARDDDARIAAWDVVVGADDGAVLRTRSLTADAFTYRVWADTSGFQTPSDSPWEDVSPHPTGTPDGTIPASVAPVLVTTDGFNTNPSGTNDPWLDASATESSGNNVDAYVDRDTTDGLTGSDFRADVTSAGEFDRTYDESLGPTDADDQGKASIIQAFYITNWLHDWFYDSGFTETAGNAQLSNYGRGGTEGDPLLAEVQDNYDGGSRDNANMSTPADGDSPAMQMYVWSGYADASVTVDALSADPDFVNSAFAATEYDVAAGIAAATTSTGSTLACDTLSSTIAGTIALIDRGSCTFAEKALRAQNAGAVGVILANNTPGAGAFEPAGTASGITIPVVGISYEDGATIRSALAAGAVSGTLYRHEYPERDGALDGTVVAHEWGHYLHHRLVSCGQAQCDAMSEGWGDFDALLMMLRDGDDLEGAFAEAAYAYAGGSEDPVYYGIRRAPYSVNPAINAFTFKHISDGEAMPTSFPLVASGSNNSEAHNAGEIWASVMLEAYVALQEGRDASESFDDIHRRMTDLVVASLALSPADTTYTEARDALLAAAEAVDPDDVTVLADAFAVRGMGSCAQSPARDSETLTGVVEDFGTSPVLSLDAPIIADGERSCDDDGILDRGERGTVRVTVTNTGAADLVGATLTLSADLADVSFPDGDTQTVPTLAPFQSTDVDFRVDLARSVTPVSDLVVTATLDAADACVTEVSEHAGMFADADISPASSTTDGFDADVGAWTTDGTDSDEIWARTPSDPVEFSWIGVDVSGITDTRLVTPDLVVSATDPLVFSFASRWSFETSDGVDWDGGVVEVSVEGGAWQDVSAYVDPGYTGTISNLAGNPLADQLAYVETNPSWPAMDTTTLDFGTAFAGSTVRFAFRIGTDEAVSAFGWEIDDVSVSGIDNTPFPAVIPQVDACDPAPVADAGPDQVVASGAVVTLDGSASSDPWDDVLSYTWTQTSGPSVTFVDATVATPTFVAPSVAADTTITLQLAVGDATNVATDTVDVTVLAAPPDTGDTDETHDTSDTATPDTDTDADTDSDTDSDTDGDTDTDADFDTDTASNPDISVETKSRGCGCTTSTPLDTTAVLIGALVLAGARRRR